MSHFLKPFAGEILWVAKGDPKSVTLDYWHSAQRISSSVIPLYISTDVLINLILWNLQAAFIW